MMDCVDLSGEDWGPPPVLPALPKLVFTECEQGWSCNFPETCEVTEKQLLETPTQMLFLHVPEMRLYVSADDGEAEYLAEPDQLGRTYRAHRIYLRRY